ncbi:hypothetical protein JHK87_034987 [Glycine soja]|nr:hypothetical protein JHK87_034987 [Glycine soja]
MACCATGMFEMGYACSRASSFSCIDASRYVFWDSFHPTEKTNGFGLWNPCLLKGLFGDLIMSVWGSHFAVRLESSQGLILSEVIQIQIHSILCMLNG